MTKHTVLTEAELAGMRLRPQIRQLVSRFAHMQDRSPQDIRVLDWGCGRGRSVAKLREQGYDAFGVDVDADVLDKGRPLFKARGLSADSVLVHMDDLPQFEPRSFDIIFSEQVFEHVDDLAAVVRNIAALTRPGGVGVHTFPGRLNFQEGHLYMPFLHWLPKNRLRRFAISMYLRCGVGPTIDSSSWPDALGASFAEKVDLFYRYSVDMTFYRKAREVAALLEAHGFNTRYDKDWPLWRRALPLRQWAIDGFYRGPTVIHTHLARVNHVRAEQCV